MRIPIYRVKLVREAGIVPPRIRGPKEVYDLAVSQLEDSDRERMMVFHLDTQHQVIGMERTSAGSLDTSIVHPREIFKAAILGNAKAIVIAHNHPSGDCTPSPEDRNVTRVLVEAGKLLDIPVLDHILVGHGRYLSFAEAGLL